MGNNSFEHQPAGSTHDFFSDLAMSQWAEQYVRFDDYYKSLWPDLYKIERITDLTQQKRGIDKILYFTDHTTMTIDEKFDRWPGTDNIFVEVWTDHVKRKPGWLLKNECDFILYAFSTGECWWLPMIGLRKAWYAAQLDTGHEWIRNYGGKFIRNKGYEGFGVPVKKRVVSESAWQHSPTVSKYADLVSKPRGKIKISKKVVLER